MLVEDEPPAWEDERELSVAGTRVDAPDRAAPRLGRRALRLGRRAAGHAAGRRRALAARARDGRARRRGGARRARRARRALAADATSQAASRSSQSEPAFAGAPVAALACEDAASARAGVEALAAALRRARLRDRRRAGARRAAPAGGSGRERERRRRGRHGRGRRDRRGRVRHGAPRCTTRSSRTAASSQWLGDELHAYVSTQGIWDARTELARAFELDPDRVHVTCEFMGGGFGAKQGATTEGMIAAYLSRAAAGRAVRVFNDRRAEARGCRPSRRDASRPTASARAATGR